VGASERVKQASRDQSVAGTGRPLAEHMELQLQGRRTGQMAWELW